MDWSFLAEADEGLLLGLAALSFITVFARNLVSVMQLVVAAWVFWRRARPAPRSIDLWSRYEDLAPPVSVIAPAFNEELSIVDSVRALLDGIHVCPDRERSGSGGRLVELRSKAFDFRPETLGLLESGCLFVKAL